MSFWQFTQVIFHLAGAQLRTPSILYTKEYLEKLHPSQATIAHKSATAAMGECTNSPRGRSAIRSIFEYLLYSRSDVRGLRQDHIFQLGVRRQERIHRPHPLHRSVQFIE